VGVESRADGRSVITGYAAVFYNPNDPGTEYQLLDEVVERIMPGAFNRAIREDDVRGLFNHDDNLVLGRVKAGTMRLSVDSRGLKYEIDPPDTTAALDVMKSIRRGDVTGSSFRFRPNVNTYRKEGGKYVIEREEVSLFDVGPVTFPAYTATAAGVRKELEQWIKSRRGFAAAAAARARAVAAALAE
jgi:HK97 family phage prohead protease